MFGWFKRKPVTDAAFTVAPAEPQSPSGESDLVPREMPPAPEDVASSVHDGAVGPLHARLVAQVVDRTRAILLPIEREPYAKDVRQLLDLVVRSEAGTIRPIPTAAKRAMSLTRDPNANLVDVAQAFEHDPSLAEGLLRLANSSWYRGGDDQVDSLREALQRTGSSGAEIVIMENALKGTLCRPGGAYDSMVAQVWLHLSRTAPVARSLARTFNVDPDTAFMLGLLHDAGKLVLFDALSEHRHRMHQATRLPYTVTRDILLHLHEPLGGLAMLRWGLELDRAAAVADHHRRDQPHVVNSAAELLFVAERADLALASGRPCDVSQWIVSGGLEIGYETLRRALDDATGGALRFLDASENEGFERAS